MTHSRPQDHYQQSDASHGERLCICRVQMRGDGAPFGDEIDGQISHPEAEEVLHLARENDNRDPAGESDDDWMRNKLDRAAQLGDAQDPEYHACHDRRHDKTVDPVFLNNPVDDYDNPPGSPADLNAGAAKSG